MQIEIRQSHLKAVSRAMSVKDIRYYLNGVLLESNGQETRMIATDGHRIHGVVTRNPGEELVNPVSVIMPDTFVKTLLKAKFPRNLKGKHCVFVLDVEGQNIRCSLPDGTETECKAIDGKFPDYQRVIPAAANGEPAIMNPYYVLDALESCADYMGHGDALKSPMIVTNGDCAAILAHEGFVAVIMPCRYWTSSDNPNQAFRAALAKPVAEEIAA